MASNSLDAIPPNLNDLLVKLKILSMIERGNKINMGSMSFVSGSSWWGWLERSMNGEGRKSLIVHLNQIIQQAIAALNEYSDAKFKILIINHLSEAKIGITNLSTTYQSDPNVVANIVICLENIDIQLNKYHEFKDVKNPTVINYKNLTEKNPANNPNSLPGLPTDINAKVLPSNPEKK